MCSVRFSLPSRFDRIDVSLMRKVSFSKRMFANHSKFFPPPDSAFDRLKINSSRPPARCHSYGIEPPEAIACRVAGQENTVPSLQAQPFG